MSVNLKQTADAAFPDRGTMGLRLTMSAGSAGRYLVHDFGEARPLLHTRFMLHLGTASGGPVHLAGAQTSADLPAWALALDPDALTVTVTVDDTPRLTASLPSGLSWHCLEVKLDTLAGEAGLWVNGRSADSAAGAFGHLAMQDAWLGGVAKAPAAGGRCDLDEWRIAEGYIGPVFVPATSAYGDDPKRWLVLYNTNVAAAGTWAEQYRARRGVPYANLLGLALSSSEMISPGAYASLAQAVNDYLAEHGLTNQIVGVLVGFGVPGYVDRFGDGTTLEATPALLQSDRTDLVAYDNANAVNAYPTRPMASLLNGDRLTARLDGPDEASATAISDRADALMNGGLGEGEEATIFFDPVAGPGFAPLTDRMRDWAESIDRMRTRLPIQRSDEGSGYADANFTSISADGFAWLWPQQPPQAPGPAGFYADPPGRRVCSVQLHPGEPTATTLRRTSPGNWIDTPLQAGYAAAAASSRAYAAGALPYARPFFEALRQGWPLAEAWFVAQPRLREGLYLVGDPLMAVALPRAGWDVFGPLNRLEQFDPNEPAYALRASQSSVTLAGEAQPAAEATAMYVVRRVDKQGRSEASLPLTRVVRVNEAPASPALRPVWPDAAAWALRLEQGRVKVRAQWDRPLSDSRVATVDLRGEVDGQGEITLDTITPGPGDRHIDRVQPLPAVEARYRWRITSTEGVTWLTPWSQRVRPATVTNHTLQTL